MGAFGDDAAAVHDDDAVSVAHGGEAVGDDQRCLAGHQAFEGVLDEAFAFAIERTGGFIEQQDGGIAQDGAGDGEALALAARQARAGFAEEAVDAIGELAQESVGMGGFSGGPDFGFGRVGAAIADVFEGAGGKDHGFLWHDGHAGADLFGVGGGERYAIEADLAFFRIVEALDKLEQRRFAGTRGADDGDGFARGDIEREIDQRGAFGLRRIMEGDMIERQCALGGDRQRRRIVGRADPGARGEQFFHAGAGAGGAHEIPIDFGERAKGTGDDGGGKDECGDGAAGQPPRDDIERTLPQHQRDGTEDEGDDHCGHAGAQADAALGGIECAFDRSTEARCFAAFLGEGLDDLDGTEHFGDHRADAGDPVLTGFRHGAHLAAEPDDGEDGDRNDQQHQHGQFWRLHRHIGDAADAHNGVAQRHRCPRGDDLFDDRSVAGQP